MWEFLQDEQGTAVVEYSLMIGLIGVVVVGAVHMLGQDLFESFSSINQDLPFIQVREDE